jgi:hypothetical protein
MTVQRLEREEDRRFELDRLRLLISDTGPQRAEPRDATGVPVLPALRSLVPGGTLARGSVVAVDDRVTPWSGCPAPSYLALALAAGATAAQSWCAVVGLPGFGIAAAAGLGANLHHVLMVDEPGDRWTEVVSVLALAVDMILVRPPARPTAEQDRRITARLRPTARQRGAVLVVAGPWSGASLALRATEPEWKGLGSGTGHLTGRRVTVLAEGRSLKGRPRTARVWLPAVDGTVIEQDQPRAVVDDHGRAPLRMATA